MKDIKIKFENYKNLNDIHQYNLLLEISDDFINNYQNNFMENYELELGIDIIRELTTLSYLGTLPKYEHNYDLQKKIRHNQIKVFKVCIPPSHLKLRGVTELLLGMKENSLG